MEKRYQVFLSSTYVDLKEERLEVMRALLELDCIPSGMEYFPATNDDQWSFIQELIDQCDYYVVVVGARYGSMSSDGLSFTEKEYRYALEKGIPVIGFVHAQPDQIPQGKAEADPDGRRKLDEFRKLVQSKLCKTWSSPAELGAVVSRSLTQLIKRNPRPGWVRSDRLASSEASEEILRLRNTIDRKDEEISRLTVVHSSANDALAQGDDQLELGFTVTLSDPSLPYADRTSRLSSQIVVTWDEVYKSFAPHLLTPTKFSGIKSGINRLIREKRLETVQEMYPDLNVGAFNVSDSTLQMIFVQFTAMNFLEISNAEDKDGRPYKLAALTPLGKDHLIKASAIKRGVLGRANHSLPTEDNAA
ncbi:DUF4062 domain-containing protein [Acidovorax sp. LjRoot38]|uniref:DUF4062 domain-containing protein n=1 Tax=Acidovorax sp. LjRoot38 TaxID=3342327 RepID=UPI003ED14A79